jgi:c-di-GMP phosphodiesterase
LYLCYTDVKETGFLEKLLICKLKDLRMILAVKYRHTSKYHELKLESRWLSMEQYVYVSDSIAELQKKMQGIQKKDATLHAASILVQIFTSSVDDCYIEELLQCVHIMLPQAEVIGSSTSGEIENDTCMYHHTVVAIEIFHDTELRIFELDYGGDTENIAAKNLKYMQGLFNIAGIEILGTAQNIDIGEYLEIVKLKFANVPVFGGGAGFYGNIMDCRVFGSKIYKKGIITVFFLSKSLHIHLESSMGWHPLGPSMIITATSGKRQMKELNGIPAFNIYEKYLGIKNDENFVRNTLEFPVLIERDGDYLARVPQDCDESGMITFSADIKKGEKARLAYGIPHDIISNSIVIKKKMSAFIPETILIFICNTRPIFLQKKTGLETNGFAKIAVTAGFYTYGEILSRKGRIDILNATMVVVGMREGEKIENCKNNVFEDQSPDTFISIIDRFAKFIQVTSAELEKSNQKLAQLATTDLLTGLMNRGRIEELFVYEVSKQCINRNVSVIMLDIDDFKKINDIYGHDVGDLVIKKVSNVLKKTIDKEDGAVGRWGGEEFFVLLPEMNRMQAMKVAERIRKILAATIVEKTGRITVSLGVTSVLDHEGITTVYKRADDALYEAKRLGKNRVCYI